MKPDNHVLALIAVGTSLAANRQPCLERNIDTALDYGADAQEIAEAIEVGRRVSQGAAATMDEFAAGLNTAARSSVGIRDAGCGCSTQRTLVGGHNG